MLSILLDLVAAGLVVNLYRTGAITPWLHLAYVSLLLASFLRHGGRGLIIRSTILSLVIGKHVVDKALAGDAGPDDLLEVPLMYVITVMLAIHATRLSRSLNRVEASEQRMRAIVEVALDCIVVIDAEGLIQEFNPAAESTFGIRRDEAIGRPAVDVILAPDLRKEDALQGAIGLCVETVGQRGDGSLFPIELTVTRLRGIRGTGALCASIRNLAMRAAAEQAREESAAKSRFLATMSHELRTPLNSVLGFAQMMRMTSTGDLNERQDRYLGHIETAGRHLTRRGESGSERGERQAPGRRTKLETEQLGWKRRGQLTKRDQEMLAYLARFEMASPEQLGRKYFGSQRVAYKRLRILQEMGLLSWDRTYWRAAHVLRVTKAGIQASGVALTPPRLNLGRVRHCLAVVELAEQLLQEYPGSSWTTERELRLERRRQGPRPNPERARIADGVLTLADGRRIGVEVEVTAKRFKFYKQIANAYVWELLEGLSEIWWYVGSPAAVRHIEATAKEVGLEKIRVSQLPGADS